MNNRYLVAKYVPDVRRMEPRNIGIVLWADGEVAMKFLRDKDAEFIDDLPNYHRWQSFWLRLISAPSIEPIRGEAVPKSKPEFMDVLRQTQEGEFLLFDGGRISAPVAQADIPDATDFLFRQIVQPSQSSIAGDESETLVRLSERAMEEAGLLGRVERGHHIACDVLGVKQDLTVSYADVVNRSPFNVFHRVNVRAPQAAVGAALMFHSLVKEKKLKNKGHCVSLVYEPDEAAKRQSSVVKMLRKVSKVVSVNDPTEAARELKKIAA